MKKLILYIQLARLDKPTGIFLLMWPCWWAIAFASYPNYPPVDLLLLFAFGSVAMRSAGCIINDIIDRKIDANVVRTKNRPLACGDLRLVDALFLLTLMLLCGAMVLFLLPKIITILSLLFFIPVLIYPFMKRIIAWPQAFLGLTFNAGAIIGWVAVSGDYPPFAAYVLYASCIAWTLGYDTIYAFQDIKDDKKIGVKSSAREVEKASKLYLAIFYIAMVLLLAFANYLLGGNAIYYALLTPVMLQLLWQIKFIDINNPDDCMRKFKSNSWLGLLVFLAIIFL